MDEHTLEDDIEKILLEPNEGKQDQMHANALELLRDAFGKDWILIVPADTGAPRVFTNCNGSFLLAACQTLEYAATVSAIKVHREFHPEEPA